MGSTTGLINKTMKFKILKEGEDIKDIVIKLYLRVAGGGEIDLVGTDSDGNEQVIMYFGDGKFTRCLITDFEGLQLDERGQIIEILD